MSDTDTTPDFIDIGSIVLGRSRFQARLLPATIPGADPSIYLTGPRGGTYFLRPYLRDTSHIYQVISWKTGQPLRDKAYKEIRVFWVGDIIEPHQS